MIFDYVVSCECISITATNKWLKSYAEFAIFLHHDRKLPKWHAIAWIKSWIRKTVNRIGIEPRENYFFSACSCIAHSAG